ncbi:phosphoribosylanthranilate isomerase [Patulibacter sp. S7RM1-6]
MKVCGITRLEDAELAADAGAWAIGMIFFRGSKRRCRVGQAQAIGASLKRRVELAGVFVNQTLDEIDELAQACNLTLVQLHGDEGPAFCAEVARRTGAKVVKAARVRTAADVRALQIFATDFHLLDTYVPGEAGGTGRTFDWSLARVDRARPGERAPRLILSGGLTPENVTEAVRTVRPYAVDVASGTESTPGRKDPERVRAFIRAATAGRNADASTPTTTEPR